MGTSCEDCDPSDEGIHLDLTGLQDYITCTTNKLNHPDITDFSPAQNGEVNAALVSWRGSGSWTVGDICFDWSDNDVPVWVCSGDGSSLSNGDTPKALDCNKLGSTTSCP